MQNLFDAKRLDGDSLRLIQDCLKVWLSDVADKLTREL
jgi:hypothetical protein